MVLLSTVHISYTVSEYSILMLLLLYVYQFSINHHEVARTRALRLREMRLYLRGGYAKNLGMVLPYYMYMYSIFGGDV